MEGVLDAPVLDLAVRGGVDAATAPVRGVVDHLARPVRRGGSAQDGRVTWTLPLVMVIV